MWLYGFAQTKVKVGVAGQDDPARLARLRGILGRRMDLRLDANEAWPARGPGRRVRPLLRFGPTALEQPVPHAEVDALADLRPALGVPVMLDESLCGYPDAVGAIERRTADLFNVRLSKCGGLGPTLRIIGLARRAGLGVQLGCHPGETGLLSAAGRHLASRVAGLRYVEGSYDRHILAGNLIRGDITFGYGGRARPLRGPAWASRSTPRPGADDRPGGRSVLWILSRPRARSPARGQACPDRSPRRSSPATATRSTSPSGRPSGRCGAGWSCCTGSRATGDGTGLGVTLAEAGFETHMPDRRGSGANRHDRGHAPSARRLLDDLAERLADLRGRTPAAPMAVAGISWGGKLALIAAADRPDPVDALALICPGLHPRVGVSLVEKLRIAWAFVATAAGPSRSRWPTRPSSPTTPPAATSSPPTAWACTRRRPA